MLPARLLDDVRVALIVVVVVEPTNGATKRLVVLLLDLRLQRYSPLKSRHNVARRPRLSQASSTTPIVQVRLPRPFFFRDGRQARE